MKIKEGFLLREVAGSFVVVAVGDAVKDFNGIINLNETSAFLWKCIEKGMDEQSIAETLVSEYEVDKEIVIKDVKSFITKLTEAGLVE